MRHALAILMLLPLPALAAALPCSIPMQGNEPASSLPGLAKISPMKAQKAALAKVGAKRKDIVSSELEAEQGCLVYSYDIRVKGKSGVDEVFVDAGNGKILLHRHESPAQEAAERAADAKPSGTRK